MREDLFDAGIFQDIFRDGCNIFRLVLSGAHRHQDVEVADGFLSASKRAGGSRIFDGVACFPDVLAESLSLAVNRIEKEAAGGALEDFYSFQDILLALFAKAGKVAEFLFAGEFLDVVNGRGPKFLPKRGDLFRA